MFRFAAPASPGIYLQTLYAIYWHLVAITDKRIHCFAVLYVRLYLMWPQIMFMCMNILFLDISRFWPGLHIEKAKWSCGQRERSDDHGDPIQHSFHKETCPVQIPWWQLRAGLVAFIVQTLHLVKRLAKRIHTVTFVRVYVKVPTLKQMNDLSTVQPAAPFLPCFSVDVGGGDSCLLLFLLCLVTVVISLGGTALYCALGDVHSSVCQDFSRNADFYMNQIQRGISHIQHWFGPGS